MPVATPPGFFARLALPAGADPGALPIIAARAIRAFADGFVSVLLPAYLLALGFGVLEVGLIGTATLLGSAFATLAVGMWGHRVPHGRLLRLAACLMALTGLGFAGFSSLWPLLVVAVVGTLNPSSGDVSVFLPLEHAKLAASSRQDVRPALFARYSLAGQLFAATGALFAAAPAWLEAHAGLSAAAALRAMFLVYAAAGVAVWLLYRAVPEAPGGPAGSASALGPSKGTVVRLAALFSVDSFAGGLVVNSLLALWLFERFGMSVAAAGVFFFWTGLLGAGSQLAAPVLGRRIGLVNTMVFTHIPANLCLVLAAFAPGVEAALALLLVRAALSQMDVPVRTAFVMAVVTPPERAAAAGYTAVPRSLAAAVSPSLTGLLFAAGALSLPLVACGVLKTAYDIALYAAFRRAGPASDD